MDKITVVPVDVYIDGELEKIDFHDTNGDFVIQAVWPWDLDPVQTPSNREEFRKWAYRMVRQLGYNVNL
jgi:hypothetical protein